ncbi:hypothetical protein [Allorhizocola rhizosphaerae]|uniref:hypothetical protein n=1 Tax=Allorhizocola rhizosphaerae TaxID=1872709 RepID=UPI000E3DBBC9|nr:hypothetical protein [Allorhizocola rhizosphaerae]
MSNVQQPEMRRSGKDALVTDSVKDKARRTGPPESDRAKGRAPKEQRSPYGPQDEDRKAES